MIKVFKASDKLFSSNGDIVVNPYVANIICEDNGQYYLDFECGIEYIDYIKQNNILAVNSPDGQQAFRIDNVEVTKTRIRTKANHVYYDADLLLIEDSYVVDKNCNDALDHLNNATSNQSPFTTTSDVMTVNSFRCVRKSLSEAIATVIERWGGHLVRDNFNIEIRNQIGNDNQVEIRYAKNLKNITATYDWNDVVTQLLPVGKNGVMLEEKYIYADIQYEIPYTKTVSFSQDDIVEEDYKDADGNLDEEAFEQACIEDLRAQAVDYIKIHQYPQTNYTLDAHLEKITGIGDVISVIDEFLGINLTTNVIAYTYDCILQRYKELQFGNFEKKLSDLFTTFNTSIQQEVDEKNDAVKVTLREELETATDKIWTALGSSYVIYDGDKILVLDSLPKETATNVIMINSGGIAFGNNGINGTFSSAWTIDNVLNMENINVINLTADLIKGGTLKLGSKLNASGILELYNEENMLIGQMDKNGLKMYGADGSYVLMNNDVGFAGYDNDDNKIYWVDKDEFHQKKSVVEEEITLCNKMRFIPITLYNGSTMINDGIGMVSTADDS